MATKSTVQRAWDTIFYSVLCFVFIVTIAYASKGSVQDRHLSFAEAKKLAEKVIQETSLKIVVNDSILMELNSYIGTPHGRTYMREALNRMEKYRVTIEKKIAEYGAPNALLAIPLVESGYRNLPQTNDMRAAGVWQFIKSTARHYGIRVDEQIDERLNVEKETDAAIRYLMATNLRFRDWGLSLLAYNAGAKTIQQGINATRSRDPWELIQAGYENDKGYLSKVYAALIIMYNPSLLEH